jgi:integrase/recombinase XerD
VLRHSCATHLLAGGAAVRHVQELRGHQDLSTTALYTKVDTRGLAEVPRRCHPRELAARRRHARVL